MDIIEMTVFNASLWVLGIIAVSAFGGFFIGKAQKQRETCIERKEIRHTHTMSGRERLATMLYLASLVQFFALAWLMLFKVLTGFWPVAYFLFLLLPIQSSAKYLDERENVSRIPSFTTEALKRAMRTEPLPRKGDE